MTAPQPATPGSDSVHAQILRALDPVEVALSGTHYIADVLVPLVDRLRAEAKTEALETAATVAEGTQMAYSPVYADWLRARAAAYRTNPSSEETHRDE